MQIAKTKNKVLISNQFFDGKCGIFISKSAWTYCLTLAAHRRTPIDKELMILITAKGGLSDIDQRLIRKFLERYDENKNDVLVIGHHGLLKLKQAHVERHLLF